MPSSVRATVESRVGQRPQARIILGDEGTPGVIDVTAGVTAAIAHALWQARGGDDITNWADAEAVIDQLFPPPLPVTGEVKPAARAPVMSGGRRPGQRR